MVLLAGIYARACGGTRASDGADTRVVLAVVLVLVNAGTRGSCTCGKLVLVLVFVLVSILLFVLIRVLD